MISGIATAAHSLLRLETMRSSRRLLVACPLLVTPGGSRHLWRGARAALSASLIVGLGACGALEPNLSETGQPPTGPEPARPARPPVLEPGQTVLTGVPAASAEALQRFDDLAAEVTRLRSSSASELLDEYPVQHASALGYSPGSAEFLDRIQSSALALNAAELQVLESNGFVISKRQQFPTFLRGYAAIYMEHLPVFVSADAMLDALHRSYDAILREIETSILIDELREMLTLMLSRIGSVEASDATKADLQLYLQVASGLLMADNGVPAGASEPVRSLLAKARAANGIDEVELFGVFRLLDFSQFTPRGHYTEPPLSEYFRAMIWLGRVDFRLIETLSDGSSAFRREQYEAMLAVHQLMAGRPSELWGDIDGAVRNFVGESDSMTVPQVASLVSDLGGLDAARAASDAAVAEAISAGGYGEQQIASHLMVNDGIVKTLPLSRSFLVFGQRYVSDSHVFSEVVYDRIAGRMMPNPLDAAFAALGNNQALRLNGAELGAVAELPGALGGMRRLIDEHDATFWSANLYNLWSSSLRALSPAEDLRTPAALGLPSIAGTEAWGRRLLNTQLGSWAQLRHDTLLYAKQSYTGIPACEFPDAYIEPYPEFFQALVRFAERGAELVSVAEDNEFLAPRISQYFDSLRSTASLLGQMAEQQRTGTPHTAAQLAFINDAIRVEEDISGCTTVEVPDGWYADLFYEREQSIELDLTIADVHTQPADEGGNIVGKVLHVGTGLPRLLTMTVDTCAGPRAYAGMAYAYHEQITEDFERLTDEVWTERVMSTPPADVPWAQGFIAE